MHEGQNRWLAFFFGLALLTTSWGQEVKLHGGFVEDSLLIGQDINYFITAAYPPELEIIFPDSGFNFSPFEYSAKSYFPTVVLDSLVYDSAVYTVQSYEVDKVQYLQLPVAILVGSDSTIVFTPTDSIYFNELAPVVSDTTQLIANLDYQAVNTMFNYPLLYLISGVIVVVLIVLFLAFEKRIFRYFKLWKIRKEYENFSVQLTTFIRKLKADPNPNTAESALNTWKNYQEKLDQFPFTKMTTKEILNKNHHKELEKPLRSIDRLIYGKISAKTVYQDFQQIEDFTQHQYQKKIAAIKHGH